MKQTCAESGEEFEITSEEIDFYKKISPIFNRQQYQIPTPTLCPDMRLKRRMAFYNLRNLYKRKCNATGADIISIYKPDTPFPVFANEYWWGDAWDAEEYGLELKLDTPFFQQMKQLMDTVPRLGIMNDSSLNSENSAYTNDWHHSKNCYFCFSFSGKKAEDCYYCSDFNSGSYVKCVDTTGGSDLELTYECVDCSACYNCMYCQLCHNSSDCLFSYNCTGSQKCLFSSNLKNKQYYVHNKQVTPEEYEKQRAAILAGSYKNIDAAMKQYLELIKQTPHRSQFFVNCEQVTGDNLTNCKQVKQGFHCINAYDSAYAFLSADIKDCYDVEFTGDSELVCEGDNADGCYQNFANASSWNCQKSYYIDNCHSCKEVFGCVGLRRKKYCILNKQYSQAEYEELVPKLIEYMKSDGGNGVAMNRSDEGTSGSWGEFFPIELSPYAYNETLAQEYFPLTKEEALAKGYSWHDADDTIADSQKTIPAAQLPDSIDDVPDDILNWSIQCKTTGKQFRILKQELEFYREMKLPVAHLHPDERHRQRMAFRNPRKLWQRQCDKCNKEIQTTFAPERPETVHCEQCYLETVY